MRQGESMATNKLKGIYVLVHGHDAKYAIWWQIGPFQNRFEVFHGLYKIDLVRDVVKVLDNEFSGFLAKLAAVDEAHYNSSGHRYRRYVSADITSLFPGATDEFRKSNAFAYKGYWIGKNSNANTIATYVKTMCEACGIEFGYWQDLKL